MTINTSSTELTFGSLPYSLSSDASEEIAGLSLPGQTTESAITTDLLPSVEPPRSILPLSAESFEDSQFLSTSSLLTQSVQSDSDNSTDITGLNDILLIDEGDSITNGGLALGEQLVISGEVRETTSLTFNWTGRDADFDNEFGLFKVNELGAVDGVAVGDEQYTASALASASRQIIFSSGQTVGNTQTLTFEGGDRLAFYLVQDRSTEEWLQSANSTAQTRSPVFFSLNNANADSVDHVRTQLLADGLWEFAWEDLLGGGDQDFNDALLTVSKGPGILEKTPGAAGQTISTQFSWTGREAGFDNEMGLFLVDDREGRINGLNADDEGYALAALSDSRKRTVFANGESAGKKIQLDLPGETYFGWYLIQDSSSQLFLDQNPNNQSGKEPLAFFSVGSANPDQHFHIKRQANGGYAWEDLFEGGDQDFNDLVFEYEFGDPQEPTAPTLQASLANDTGISDTDKVTSDPTIQGSVLGTQVIAALKGGFGDAAIAEFGDITSSLQGTTFTLDRPTLAALNGGELRDEVYRLRLVATDETGRESEAFELDFVLDTTTQTPELRLAAEFDSGVAGDLTTSFDIVTLVGEAEPNVELSLEGTTLTATSDDDGFYSFSGVALPIGDNPFTVIATDAAGNQLTATTTIIRTPVDANAPTIQAELVNDTGTSDADGITFDAAIQGSVTSNTDVVSLRAGFNDTPATEFVDISETLQGDTFTLSKEVLTTINGGTLPDGEYMLKLIAADATGSESEIAELPFLLDTVIQSPTLQLAASYDSETVGDLETSFSKVKLEGKTDADAIVELKGADVATASDTLGNFSLRSVELSEGDNGFVVQATDAAGNQADGSLTIGKTQRQALRNNAPVLTSTPSTSLPTDSRTYQYQVTATDEDNDPLVYSLANGPAGASISEQGLLSWTVESDDSSSDFAVQVDDGQGGIATQNFAVDVAISTGQINGFVWNDANRNGIFDQFQSGSDSEIEPSSELEIEPNFDDVYDVFDLGSVPGLPTSYGGLTLNPDNLNQLLIGGNANREEGAIYAVDVVRGAGNHIIGFEGSATQYGEGAYNDGGLQFNDEGVLFASRWPENELGQSLPGSRTTDKIIDLAPFGIAQSHASLSFVPEGIPGEGGLKFVSWSGGQWYDVELVPDGNGTYDIANVDFELTLPGGPEGIAYVPAGSPLFDEPSLLVAEWSANNISVYEVDAEGDPILDSRQLLLQGLTNAEGAFIDLVTGDFLFSTFGGGDHIVSIQGFSAPFKDELGLADVVVYLDLDNDGTLDSEEPQTITNQDGVYNFSNITPGTYTVRQTLLPGYVQTFPPNTPVVEVSSGSSVDDIDFAQVLTDEANQAPVFVNNPLENFSIPLPGTASGDVNPEFLNLSIGENETFFGSVSITLPEQGDTGGSADIVLLVDESGSMQGEHEWLTEMVVELNAALEARGITGNRYSLIGFGGDEFDAGVRSLTVPDPIIEIYGPGNQLIGTQSSNLSAAEFSLPTDGDYTVFITTDEQLPIDYDLQAEVSKDPFIEPVGFNQAIEQTIEANGRQTFDFEAPAGLRVWFDNITTQFSTVRGSLIDPDGETIADVRTFISSGPFSLPKSGTYSLVMDGGNEGGEYAFQLIDMSDASTLAFDTPISGTIEVSETQIFKVEGSAGQRLFFESGEIGPDWWLYSSDNKEIDSTFIGFDLEAILPGDGTYWLVLENDAVRQRDYTFEIITPDTTTADINFNELNSGVVSEPGEFDIYRFEGQAGQSIWLDSVGPSSTSNPTIELFSADGELLFSTPRAQDTELITLQSSGTYSVLVGGDDQLGDYQFQVIDAQAAPTVDVGSTTSGSLSVENSTAIFKINGAAYQQLKFEPLQQSNAVSASWQLFTPGNKQLKNNSIDRAFDAALADDGEYYLVLTSAQDEQVDYSFQVSDVTSASIDTAGFNIINGGTIEANGTDTYTLNAPAGTRVLLDVISSTDRNISISLTDPDNEVVDSIIFNFDEPLPSLLEKTGTYTLTVGGGSSGGEYSFRVLDLTNAIPLAIDTTTDISLPLENGIQLYEFEGRAGTRLFIDADQSSSLLGGWNLFYPGGGEYSAVGTSLRKDIEAVLPADGKYVLYLQSPSSQFSEISFKVITPETQREEIEVGEVINGSLGEAGEIDRYEFSGTKGQKVWIDNLYASSENTRTRLISPTGSQLFGDGNRLTSLSGIEGSGGDQSFVDQIGPITLPEDGLYTLRVLAGDSTGDYSFRVNAISEKITVQTGDRLMGRVDSNLSQGFQIEDALAGQTLSLATVDDDLFSDIAALSQSLGTLSTQRGGKEDGYAGLNEALQLPFRDDAAVNLVIITDEERDEVEQLLTFDLIQNRIGDSGAILSAVLNAEFDDENGDSALGIDAFGNSYIPDEQGGFSTSEGGIYTGSRPVAFGLGVGDTENIEEEYVNLALALDGTIWDLNQLRSGGDAAVSFTKAFVELQSEAISEQFLVDVESADSAIAFTNATGPLAGLGSGDTANFDVEITGDGDAESFELQFIRPDSGFVLGTLPVVVNQSYVYPALAVDPDGDPLTYSFVEAPEGAVIDPSTGAVTWNPPAIGSYNFSIEADDGRGGIALQDFVVVVKAVNEDNQAPSITSAPTISEIDANQTFSYAVEASDPDGDTLSYYLTQAPTGLSIDRSTGAISWQPTNEQTGGNLVEMQVLDGKGKSDTQQFEVSVNSVAPNRSPFFNSAPVTTVLTGENYQYQPNVVDPEDDTLTYSLRQQPEGMQIDADTGLVAWQSDLISLGEYSVVIAVEDGAGNTTLQSFQLVASDALAVDTQAPDIDLAFASNRVDIGGTFSLQVRATDDRGLASLSVEIDGRELILSPDTLINGQLYETETQLTEPAVYPVVVRATDSAGNEALETFNVGVFDPSDTELPEVSFDLDGITVGTTISEPFDILGKVDDPNLISYRVEYAPKSLVNLDNVAEDNPAFVLLNESSIPVDGVLGTLDPRFMNNDQYFVRVVAKDANGINVQGFEIGVSTENKIGNFTLDATDLSIPLTGIPINVQRRYDTLQTSSSASFGYGWEFAGLDARITESAPQEPASLEGSIFANVGFKFGDRVTLTTPNGKRVGFTFRPEVAIAGLLGTAFRPVFVPDPGVEETLTVEDIYLSQGADGTFELYLFSFGYNPSEYQLTTKNNLTYTYNQFDGLQTVEDLNGNVLTYSADGITSSTGETVRFERDSEDRITRITDPAGNSISYQYDENGDLVAVTDRASNTTRYEYDPDQPHYLAEEIDPLGRSSVRTEFDDFGRIERIIDAEGNALEIEIDFDGATDTQVITDPLNNTTVLTYDDRGNVIRQVDAEGGATEYEYFDDDMLKSVTDPRGFKTAYTYDERGNLLTETDPLGNATINTYNDLNQVLTTEDARGNTTINRYNDDGTLKESEDAAGNVTKYDYFANGNLKTITDANDNDTNYRYDRFGRLEEVEDVLGAVTRFGYDNAGNLKTITTPLGNNTTFGYDAEGQVVKVTDAKGNSTQIQYNAAGDRTAIIDALGRRTEFKYNSRGLETEIRYADGTSSKTVYDVLDRVAEEIDQNGNETEFDYDGLGRLIEVTDALGHETEYRYDKSSNLTEQIDALGRTTKFDYDELNRLIETTLPLGQVETQTYDKVGNLNTLTNFNQQTITYEYDPNNLLQAVRLPDAPDELYTYTKTGEIDTITDARGVTDYDYDDVDQLLRRTDPDDSFVAYTYDLDGNMESLTSPSGTVEYTYDGLGLLKIVKDRQDNSTSYNYDDVGNLITTEFANGVVETRAYDLLNRPELFETRNSNGNTLSFYTYTLDGIGNRLSVEEQTGRAINYGYDDLYRVTQEQIVDPIDGDWITDYVYDDVGNWISRDSGLDETNTYGYDDNDRLLTKTNGGVITSYDYDDAGNLTAKAVAGSTEASYQWNSKGELVGATINDDGSDKSIQYQYDTNGTRISQIVDGQVTHFLVDKEQQEFAQVIEEYTNGIVNVSYTHGLDLISQQRSNKSFFYHTDGIGSTRLLTNDSEAVVNSYVYDAYGKAISQMEGVRNSYKFTGEQFDENANLYYLRARYMNFKIGRFISRDPFLGLQERPLSLNKYLYAEGNPVNAIDPSGQMAIEYIVLLGGLAASVVSATDRALSNCTGLLSRDPFIPIAISKLPETLGVAVSILDGVGGIIDLACSTGVKFKNSANILSNL